MSKGILSWGKPRIFVKKLDSAGESTYQYRELPTPVDDSTNLETTEGDKTEAKIEGGEVEAVRYDKSTYKLTMQFRMKVGSKMPFENSDGVVTDNYEVVLAPEHAEAFGLQMKEAHVSIKSSFTTNDGVLVDVSFDALTQGKDESGKDIPQCQFGVVKVSGTETAGDLNVEFTKITAEEDKLIEG